MNNDDADARAQILALTAAKNILLKLLDRNGTRALQAQIVDEIRSLAGEDSRLVHAALNYAQDEIVPPL